MYAPKDERKARRSEERARRLERRRFESDVAAELVCEIGPDIAVNDSDQVEPSEILHEVFGTDLLPSSPAKGLNLKPVEASVVQGLKLKPLSPSEVARLVRKAKVKSDHEAVNDITKDDHECLNVPLLDDISEPKKKLQPILNTEPRKEVNAVNIIRCQAILKDQRIPREKAEKKKEFQCPECLKKFAGMGVLKLHIKRIHSNIQFFICGQCALGFKTKRELWKHEVTHGKNTQQKTKITNKSQEEKLTTSDEAGGTIILVTDGESSEPTSTANDSAMISTEQSPPLSSKIDMNETLESGIEPSEENDDDENAAFFRYMATQTRRMKKRDKRAFFREIQEMLPKYE